MSRTLKICLVCIAWAAGGTQVALSFTPFWLALPVGLFAGCLGGYLTCDWRRVMWAIPHAWRRATAWRPNTDYWRAVWYFGLLVNNLFLTIVIPLSLLWILDPIYSSRDKLIITIGITFICGILIPLVIGLILASTSPHDLAVRQKELTTIRRDALRFNFFSFYFWVGPRYLYRLFRNDLFPILRQEIPKIPGAIRAGMASACRNIWLGLTVSARFLWHLYRLVHTEERWLSSVDIAFGIIAGSWFLSPLVGGLAGGAFWLANRLLIAGCLLRTLPVRIRS